MIDLRHGVRRLAHTLSPVELFLQADSIVKT